MLSVDRGGHAARPDRLASSPVSTSFPTNMRDFYSADRATAFQAPLWMAMIHSPAGAGGLDATQHTLTMRNRADGALLAVIPLVLQRSKGIRLLRPADFGVCDYNSIVGRPQHARHDRCRCEPCRASSTPWFRRATC